MLKLCKIIIADHQLWDDFEGIKEMTDKATKVRGELHTFREYYWHTPPGGQVINS